MSFITGIKQHMRKQAIVQRVPTGRVEEWLYDARAVFPEPVCAEAIRVPWAFYIIVPIGILGAAVIGSAIGLCLAELSCSIF